MPDWLTLVLATVVICGAVVLLVVVRRRDSAKSTTPTPDVIEYVTMMVGVVYAIVLGLAIAGAWDARQSAEEWVRVEAQALHETAVRAEVYPDETRQRIDEGVTAYVGHVVHEEWAALTAGEGLTDRGGDLLADLRDTLLRFEPETAAEAQLHAGVLDRAALADEARTARGEAAEPTMPGLVWFGLLAGGVVAVGMLFALRVRRSAREVLLAGLFSALIVFLLFLIWHFDDPFARGLDDAASPFRTLFPDVAGD